MDRDLASIFLPEGILDYFDLTSISATEEGYSIYVEEKLLPPPEYLGHRLTSKGFYEEVTIKDFPIRGKACFLKVKRRRWQNETLDRVVSRDWELAAKGTRMTKEFASFLKAVHRYDTGKL